MTTSCNKFPYDVQDVETALAEELMKHYTGEKTGFVTVGPKGYFFPHKYKECAEKFYNMPLRADDVFVVSFPRSGTTWTQELVWLIQNNLNFGEATNTPIAIRFPFLDYSMLLHPTLERQMFEENKGDGEKIRCAEIIRQPGTEKVAKMPSPRFIKSHLPLSLLPPDLLEKTKVVYVARDPRDVAVSLYHFYRMNKTLGKPENFKSFWNDLLQGRIYFAPIIEHVKEAWQKRHHPNMLFIFYEELHKNLPTMVQKVADFFGKLYTKDQIKQICEYLNFDNFKNNKAVNTSLLSKVGLCDPGQSFIRKGMTGDWREYFDQEMIEETSKWLYKNLEGTDLTYPSYNISRT